MRQFRIGLVRYCSIVIKALRWTDLPVVLSSRLRLGGVSG